MITDPCVVYDLDDATYHADPVPESSLSVSGAKTLLDCPARFAYEREHPKTSKAFDFGHAAHARVLGVGAPVVTPPVDLLASNGAWSTKAAKEWVAEQQAAGATVLKESEIERVAAMADQIAAHPIAGDLLTREGEAELSMFARDPDTSIMLRGRADWLTTWLDGRPCIVDYKSAEHASPDEFRWDAGRYGYYMQDPWYRELARLLTGEEHLFVFVVQEKSPPYLVTVHELDDEAREIGTQRNRVARQTYLRCMTTGEWPGYPAVVNRLSIPNARYAPEAAA